MSFHSLYGAGLIDLVPIVPPGAELSPNTKIRPQDRGKVPGLRNGSTSWHGFDWRGYQAKPGDLDKWASIGAGIGLKTTRFPAFDIDVLDPELSAEIQAVVLRVAGWAPIRVGRWPKAILAYRCEAPFLKRRVAFQLGGSEIVQAVEVLGDGQQYVAEGLHAGLLTPYAWDVPLDLVGAEGLTCINEDTVERVLIEIRELLYRREGVVIGRESARRQGGGSEPEPVPLEQMTRAMAALPNNNEMFPTRDDYMRVGFTIKAGVGEEGFPLFLDWALRWEGNANAPEGNAPETVRRDWGSMHPPFRITTDWLFALAQEHGYAWAADEMADVCDPIPEGGVVPGGDRREELRLGADWINDTVRASARLLDDKVYLRGAVPSVLVRVGEVKTGTGVETEDGDTVLHGVRHSKGGSIFIGANPALVGYLLDDRARFTSFDARSDSWRPKPCPPEICKRLVGAATELGFRSCSGIATVPLLRGGQLVTRSGYDAASGLVLDLTEEPVAVPENAGREEALAALPTILAPFREYIGEDVDLRTAFTAAVLTAVLRPSLPAAPAILLNANIPGAGKGKAARALAYIATGRLPSIITEGPGPDEMEKRLAAAVLSGTPAILIDNLQRALASSTLESGLTEGVATIRLFGSLLDVTVPCSALVLITANNATLRGDMLRRMLPIRILARTDEPEARKFDFDPYEEAKANRTAIVAAALTIVLAWQRHQRSGTAAGGKTLGSFEKWSELICGATEWLIGKNPIELIQGEKSRDPSYGAEKAMINALFNFQNEQKSRSFLARQAVAVGDGLWSELLSFRNDFPSVDQVGKWLRSRRDRMFGDKLLTRRVDGDGVAVWRISKF